MRRWPVLLALLTMAPAPALAAGDAPDAGHSAAPRMDRPIANPLPQPATVAEPPPSSEAVDPARFGARPADAAYGAYQRGLYKTAYNLALERAKNGDPAAEVRQQFGQHLAEMGALVIRRDHDGHRGRRDLSGVVSHTLSLGGRPPC